jgi:hypothetical protein
MHRVPFLTAPTSIVIDDEPLGVNRGDWPPGSAAGFELVPAWQARPGGRSRRRALTTLPALVAAAVALSIGPGRGATPVRPGPARAVVPARPALVVQASPAPATDASRARR